MPRMPEMYSRLAAWWSLISDPRDYAGEAAFFKDIFLKYADLPPKTMLELGCGGGNNASYLKLDFAMTLVDLAPGMLAVSQGLNPECHHLLGDMRSVRLDKRFDTVLIHDAIMYMTREEDLLAAMLTAAVHCKPGGVALFCPDETSEIFVGYTDHGGSDGEDRRGIRYLEWCYDPDPADSTYVVEFAYLLHQPGKPTELIQDRHEMGLFSRETWLRLMREAGFRAEMIRDTYDRDLFVGVHA